MKYSNKLFILSGISGSGKSTLASRLSVEHDAVIIETDKIRKELTGSEEDQTANNAVFSLARMRVLSLIQSGKNVILDATNVKKRDRQEFIKIGKSVQNCEIISCHIVPNLSIAKKRNSLRERKVPDHIIEKQYNNFQTPTLGEGFDNIVIIN